MKSEFNTLSHYDKLHYLFTLDTDKTSIEELRQAYHYLVRLTYLYREELKELTRFYHMARENLYNLLSIDHLLEDENDIDEVYSYIKDQEWLFDIKEFDTEL